MQQWNAPPPQQVAVAAPPEEGAKKKFPGGKFGKQMAGAAAGGVGFVSSLLTAGSIYGRELMLGFAAGSGSGGGFGDHQRHLLGGADGWFYFLVHRFLPAIAGHCNLTNICSSSSRDRQRAVSAPATAVLLSTLPSFASSPPTLHAPLSILTRNNRANIPQATYQHTPTQA